ncbi:hypothetical protein PQX77_008128, partial [Marasmius sp. AFHP31]
MLLSPPVFKESDGSGLPSTASQLTTGTNELSWAALTRLFSIPLLPRLIWPVYLDTAKPVPSPNTIFSFAQQQGDASRAIGVPEKRKEKQNDEQVEVEKSKKLDRDEGEREGESIGLCLSAISAATAPGLSLAVSGNNKFAGAQDFKITTSPVNTGDEALELLKDPRNILSSLSTDRKTISNAEGASPTFTGARAKFVPEYLIKNVEDAIVVLEPGASFELEHD